MTAVTGLTPPIVLTIELSLTPLGHKPIGWSLSSSRLSDLSITRQLASLLSTSASAVLLAQALEVRTKLHLYLGLVLLRLLPLLYGLSKMCRTTLMLHVLLQ